MNLKSDCVHLNLAMHRVIAPHIHYQVRLIRHNIRQLGGVSKLEVSPIMSR